MMFSKAQQEIVNLALKGKRLKEVVMLLDKSEDEILLDAPAEWYTVLQAENEEIKDLLPMLLDAVGVLKELSQEAEQESVRRGSLKALRDRWEDLSRLCRVRHLDGHTLRLTPPAGVTSSTIS